MQGNKCQLKYFPKTFPHSFFSNMFQVHPFRDRLLCDGVQFFVVAGTTSQQPCTTKSVKREVTFLTSGLHHAQRRLCWGRGAGQLYSTENQTLGWREERTSRSVCSSFLICWSWHGLEIQVTGTGSQDQKRGFRLPGVTQGSKVRAKVHTDAWRALLVIWRRAQVPQAILLQAA